MLLPTCIIYRAARVALIEITSSSLQWEYSVIICHIYMYICHNAWVNSSGPYSNLYETLNFLVARLLSEVITYKSLVCFEVECFVIMQLFKKSYLSE